MKVKPYPPASRLPVHGWLAVLLVFAPFYTGWLILPENPPDLAWLIHDYLKRIVCLIGFVAAFEIGLLPPIREKSTISVAIALAIAACALIQLSSVQLVPYLGLIPDLYEPATYPRLGNATLQAFDLTVGLLLVAASEELAFRRFALALFERWRLHRALAVVLSSAAFAAIHVHYGFPSIAGAFITGVVLAGLFLVTGRIWACIGVHYVLNYVVFSRLYAGPYPGVVE